MNVQKGEIKRQDILEVASWAKFFYPPKIKAPESIPFTEGVLNGEQSSLLTAFITLEQNVRGIGATYLSKVLRFSFSNRRGIGQYCTSVWYRRSQRESISMVDNTDTKIRFRMVLMPY